MRTPRPLSRTPSVAEVEVEGPRWLSRTPSVAEVGAEATMALFEVGGQYRRNM